MTLHIIMIDWSRKFIAVKIADLTEKFYFHWCIKRINDRKKKKKIFYLEMLLWQGERKYGEKIKRVHCHMSYNKMVSWVYRYKLKND